MKTPLLFLLGMLVFIPSCKKTPESQVQKIPVVNEISLSGDLYVYSPITFTSTFSKYATKRWSVGIPNHEIFGDTISWEFAQPQKYNIMATADGDTLYKTITITLGEIRMNKTHNWHKEVYYWDKGTKVMIYKGDTSFALNVSERGVIVLPAETRLPIPSYTISALEYDKTGIIHYGNYGSQIHLVYYPSYDSIYFECHAYDTVQNFSNTVEYTTRK